MNSCLCNEAIAYRYRWCRPTPKFRRDKIDHQILSSIKRQLVVDIREHFDNEPFSVLRFLKSKTGALGRRYMRAAEEIIRDGFDLQRDSNVKAFIKNERYFELKKPRAIMGRNPKFNIFFAKFVTAIEQAFYKVKGVTAAMNYSQVGDAFASMREGDFLVKGDDNVMQLLGFKVEGDATSFESSQRPEAMQLEYDICKSVFEDMGFDDLDQYTDLFATTALKSGRFPNGYVFEHMWTNGSGEMNTTLRNTILMYIAVRYFLIVNKGRPHDQLEDTFSYFGFDMKLIVRHNDHDVGFCSGKFIKVNANKTFFVADLHKTLRSVGVMINKDFDNHLDTYYYSLGRMYTALYAGIPIYEDLGKWLMTCARSQTRLNTKAFEHIYSGHQEFKLRPTYNFDVDEVIVRSELIQCFDISPAEFEALKSHFSTALVFPDEHCKHRRPPRPVKYLNRYGEFDIIAHFNHAPPTDDRVVRFRDALRRGLPINYSKYAAD